jgi:hypothetical protein
MRSDGSSTKRPTNRSPQHETTQKTLFSLLNIVERSPSNRAKWSHHPKNRHLRLLTRSPPVHYIHAEIEITGSNDPPQIKSKHISRDIRPFVKGRWRSLTQSKPYLQDCWHQRNQYERSGENCSVSSDIKYHRPKESDQIGKNEEEMRSFAPLVFYQIVDDDDEE